MKTKKIQKENRQNFVTCTKEHAESVGKSISSLQNSLCISDISKYYLKGSDEIHDVDYDDYTQVEIVAKPCEGSSCEKDKNRI